MKLSCTRFSSRLLAERILKPASLIVALFCVVFGVRAQIPINAGVNPTITFDAAPVLTIDQWAYMTTLGAEGAGTWSGAGAVAAIDTAMNSLDVSAFNNGTNAVPTSTTYGTARFPRHNTVTGKMTFMPTGVAGTVLRAALRNTSGATLRQLQITYDYEVPNGIAAGGSEPTEAPGLQVYFSTNGLPNSWARIPTLAGNTNLGSQTATISVDPWLNGSDIFLVWVDDNAATNPDWNNAIDNVVFIGIGDSTCVAITNGPANITIPERGAASFSIMATGAPQAIRWYRQEPSGGAFVEIPGATSSTYVAPPAVYPGDDGAKFRATVSNALCQATSPIATLTVTPDTTAPTVISAIGDINPDDGQPTLVRLTFSEPMDSVLVNEANFILFKTGTDPEDPFNATVLFPLTAVLTNGTNALIYTEARVPLTDYSIRMLDQRDASSGNNPTVPNPLTVPLKMTELLIGFDANNVWKYAIETNLFGTGWETVGYNDSDPVAWPEGPAGLGLDASANGVPIRTATAYTPNSAPQFFRRHFFLPSGTNGLSLNMRYVFEDGAVVYINGQEAGRFGVAAGALTVATRATAAAEPAPIIGPVPLPTTNVVPGDNVIAVVVIQNGATSSDIELAVELTATISQFAAGPPTITAQPTGQTVGEGANVTLSVGVSGAVPLHYQWRSNGVPIGGANSSSYSLFGAKPSYSGTYSVVVTNDLGTVTSAGALLTVTNDPTVPTLWGVNVDSNRTQLTLSFTKPLQTASAQIPGNYSVEPIGGSPIAVTTATEVNNTNVVLTLASPLVDGQSMNLVFSGIVDRTEAAHPITPKTNGVASLVSLSAAHAWRYNQDGLDLGTAWHATAFNDSAWLSGAALFDVVRGATRDTVGGEPVRTVLSLTNQLPGDAGTNITWYFRTHFNLPVSSNNIPTRINLFLDDGAVFYINNAEAYRNGITNVPVNYTNFAQTSVGTASRLGSFAVDGSSMVAGDNVLAVEVHQTSITSSDVTLGVELYAIVPGGLPNTPAKRVRISYNAITGQTTVSWTAAGCTLQETTALAIPSTSTVWVNSSAVNGVPFTATGSTKFYRLSCTP